MSGFYQEALERWRSTGDRPEIANALYNASFSYVFVGEGVDATNLDPDRIGLAMMEEALAIYRELDDKHGAGNATWAVGNWHYFHQQRDIALASFREAFELFSATSDETMVAWAHRMLGTTLLRLGQVDEAADHIKAAMRQFKSAGDASALTLALEDYSELAAARGDLPRSARLHGAARALAQSTGANLSSMIDDLDVANAENASTLMSEEEIERYAAEGRAMSLSDAVAYALEGA
jgi:tetratricopeptide (TPR) repeat protein